MISTSPNETHRSPRAEEASDFRDSFKSLTPQQARVFCFVCDGLSNKGIAAKLGVTESTIKAHMSAVLAKLGCANRTQAVMTWLRHCKGQRRLQPAAGAAHTHDDRISH